jgi:hypothetical protein
MLLYCFMGRVSQREKTPQYPPNWHVLTGSHGLYGLVPSPRGSFGD